LAFILTFSIILAIFIVLKIKKNKKEKELEIILLYLLINKDYFNLLIFSKSIKSLIKIKPIKIVKTLLPIYIFINPNFYCSLYFNFIYPYACPEPTIPDLLKS